MPIKDLGGRCKGIGSAPRSTFGGSITLAECIRLVTRRTASPHQISVLRKVILYTASVARDTVLSFKIRCDHPPLCPFTYLSSTSGAVIGNHKPPFALVDPGGHNGELDDSACLRVSTAMDSTASRAQRLRSGLWRGRQWPNIMGVLEREKPPPRTIRESKRRNERENSGERSPRSAL